MAFKPINRALPRRLWALLAPANFGKSTFASRMKGPKVVLDTDHRFDEVVQKLGLNPEENLKMVDNAADTTDVVKIEAALKVNMPGAEVGTIVLDSLTGVIQPLVTAALVANDRGTSGNKSAGFAGKAAAMRMLTDAVNKWGTDVLYIWHMEDRAFNGKKTIHETLPKTESDALVRALNMQLQIVTEGEGANRRFGIYVSWARNGKSDFTIWDEPGNFWKGMPERIEKEVYADGVKTDTFGGEGSAPVFTSMAEAINWAVEKGAFPDREAAKVAYAKVKETAKPTTAEEMYNAWIPHVKTLLQQPVAAMA